MAKDGYMQIKVQDLNKRLDELKTEIESKLKKMENAEKKIITNINKATERLLPLLELEDKLQGIQKSALNNCDVQTNNKLDTFENEILIKLDRYMKDDVKDIRRSNLKSIKEVHINLKELLNKSIETIERDRKCDAARIDNLIMILNKRGITDITSVIYDAESGKVKKKRKLNDAVYTTDEEVSNE